MTHAEARDIHLRHRDLYGRTKPCPCYYCDEGWNEFINMWIEIAEYKIGLRCRICKRWWTLDPGTIYCAGQHGACGICNKPRAGCKCLRTELI